MSRNSLQRIRESTFGAGYIDYRNYRQEPEKAHFDCRLSLLVAQESVEAELVYYDVSLLCKYCTVGSDETESYCVEVRDVPARSVRELRNDSLESVMDEDQYGHKVYIVSTMLRVMCHINDTKYVVEDNVLKIKVLNTLK